MLLGGEFDADAGEEVVVGMIAGEREDEIIVQPQRAVGVSSDYVVGTDFSRTVLLK